MRNNMRKSVVVACVVLGAVVQAGVAVAQPKAERFDVGAAKVRLVVREVPESGVIAMQGALYAGEQLNPGKRRYIAELTAAMLMNGTAKQTKLQMAEKLEAMGAQAGASADWAFTMVNANAVAAQFEPTLALLAEAMIEPSFPQEELVKLKARMAASMKKEDDQTRHAALTAMRRRMYPEGHPLYVAPLERRLADLEAVTRDDLVAFHKANYGGDGLTVTIVGKISSAQAKGLVEKYFGGWRGGARKKPELARGLAPATAYTEKIERKGKINCDVFIGLPVEVKFGDADYWPLVLANAALGGSTFTSRLGGRIRDTEGLTYGVFSAHTDLTYGPGHWNIWVTALGSNVPKALNSAREEVEKYVAKGITEKELATEKRFLIGGFALKLDSNEELASWLTWMELSGAGADYLDRFADYVNGVKKADVDRVIRRVFGNYANAQVTMAGEACGG